ncbi:MAG: hypothetical protein ABI193_06290, partial [Minicystis sp.]
MQRTIFGLASLALTLGLVACGSSVDPSSSAAGTTSGTTAGAGGSGGDVSTTGNGGSSSTTTTATTTTGTGGQTGETPAYKSYVILGDSISDHGGQGPFFY